ncbi:MAG: IS701 family transposase [Planctomycetes bacterium]|nr:IS701 family transposase [Planctomycetota bacterium]
MKPVMTILPPGRISGCLLEGEVVNTAEIQRLARYIREYQDRFDPLFGRAGTRRWAREYMGGLLMDMERKNCWQIAEARKIPAQNLKSLQHFLYGSPWDWKPVLAEMGRMVDEHLGSDDGIVVVDESGVRRWGEKSVGIARQYIGRLGKVDNGQVGVYLAYACEQGQAFLDARLFVPEAWFEDPRRCREAGIPDDAIFRTKPELAAAMVESARARGVRARWVTADEVYGDAPEFLDVVDAVGWWYVAEVQTTVEVWPVRPKTLPPSPRGAIGRPRKKPRLARDSDRSAPVAVLGGRLAEKDWRRIAVAQGPEGRRVYDFAFLRVVEKRGGLPGRDAWLMVRRSLDQTPEIKHYLSNAPRNVDLERMAAVGSERWRVDGAIKEAKGQTGLAESEGRNWKHWHHHTTLSMLAHAFLTCARVSWAQTYSPPLGAPDPETRRLGKKGAAA